MRHPALTRRELLAWGGGAAGLALLGCRLPDETHLGSEFLPTPGQPLTPTGQFFIVQNFGLPEVPSPWRLEVRGLVARRLTLGFADLARFETVTREITLECIGNTPGGGLISSAAFTGIRLADLLADAGIDDAAHGLQLAAADGYAALVPVEAALADEPLLVVAMGGAALAHEHGAPLRALFPGKHGMFSVKWLTRLTLTRDWATWGALTGLSNVVEGETPVRSRIDPLPGPAIAGMTTQVTGIALTSGAGVDRVEVLADGAWQPAEIIFPGAAHLWTLWRFAWRPRRAGSQALAVRAFDRAGRTQDDTPRFPYDSGAIHRLGVVVG